MSTTGVCIKCNICVGNCPVANIWDETENNYSDNIYYVDKYMCIECIKYFQTPPCINEEYINFNINKESK